MTPASTSAPPKIRNGGLGMFVALIAGMAITGGAAVIFFFNPGTSGFYPVCLFHQLTGLNCPGCGATRASYALLHGHFRAALQDNALFVFGLAGLAVRGAWFVAAKRAGRPAGAFVPATILWGFLVVGIVFSILRNLPAFSFLSP